MRLRSIKNADVLLEKSSYFLKNPEFYRGKFKMVFSNDYPIYIEIGCGKGQFIINMAKSFPNINFIGVEKYESVLVRAIKKIKDEHITNLRFICYDAIKLDNIFDKEIDMIYLNFSDPWPKKKHEKRRLTYKEFLNTYDKLFKKQKTIILKTDNINFFSFSLMSLSKNGYILEEVSLDLKNTDFFNIETEYEQKFSNLGYKINYVKAKKV